MDRRMPTRLGLLVVIAAAALGGCSSSQLQAERDALWDENQELRADRTRLESAFQTAQAENQRLTSQIEQLQSRQPAFARANEFAGVEGVETIRRADGGVAVRIPGDVLFAPGKIALKDSAKQTLAQIADVIKRRHPGKKVRVEGYTDTDPIRKSGWADNLELSLQRAASVYRYLEEKGLRGSHMYAAGFGPHKPQSSKSKSRRVEIVVLGGAS